MADTPKKPGIVQRAKQFFYKHKIVILTVLALVLFGLFTTLLSVGLERYFHPAHPGEEVTWYGATILKITDHVALGLFSVAILGVIIELPDMHKYFQERIRNTIISRDFIRQLSKTEQERLQEQSLEAFFGVDEIGKDGGFYKFYVEKIRAHIAGSYRKGTNFTTVVQCLNDSLFKVTDTISYTCKKGVDGLQKEVSWTAEQDEIEDFLQLTISTRPDANAKWVPHCFDKEKGVCDDGLTQPPDTGFGYALSLEALNANDALEVQVTVTYVVSRERPFPWGMAFLSDGLTGEVHFPLDLEIVIDRFGMDKKSVPDKSTVVQKDGVNVYAIGHQGWLLPYDGYSFYFRPKAKPTQNVPLQVPAVTEVSVNMPEIPGPAAPVDAAETSTVAG